MVWCCSSSRLEAPRDLQHPNLSTRKTERDSLQWSQHRISIPAPPYRRNMALNNKIYSACYSNVPVYEYNVGPGVHIMRRRAGALLPSPLLKREAVVSHSATDTGTDTDTDTP
jgi:hypothetical protein